MVPVIEHTSVYRFRVSHDSTADFLGTVFASSLLPDLNPCRPGGAPLGTLFSQRLSSTRSLRIPYPTPRSAQSHPAMYSFVPFLALVLWPLVGSASDDLDGPFHDARNDLKSRPRNTLHDVAQFNFSPFPVADLHILYKRSSALADYSCALSCKRLSPRACELYLHIAS